MPDVLQPLGSVCLKQRFEVTLNVCRAKIEKEKREHAKQHGMIRTEFSGGEIAEEMEKERRMFQLQMCEVSRCFCSCSIFTEERELCSF